MKVRLSLMYFYIDTDFELSVTSITFTRVLVESCINVTALPDGRVEDIEVLYVNLVSDDSAVHFDIGQVHITLLDRSIGENSTN